MPEHYFSADPAVPFEREAFTAEPWGNPMRFDTGSGVFSRGHLDHATAVLFRETEPPAGGRIDIGDGLTLEKLPACVVLESKTADN